MERINQILKKVWNFLNGKKRAIACFYWIIIIPLISVFSGYLPILVLQISKTIGIIFSGIGLTHYWAKEHQRKNYK